MTELPDAAVSALAEALYMARQTGRPVEPLTDARPAMTVSDAYRLQSDLVTMLLADGDRIIGYKLGLTSAAMQAMFGVGSPRLRAGAAALGHPAASAAWLVRVLAARGRGLSAGHVVLSGGLTEAVPVSPGDVIVARFDRIGTVELACR